MDRENLQPPGRPDRLHGESLIQTSAALFGITLFAAALRFFRLGEWSFWGDEIFTLSGKPDGFFPSVSTALIRLTTDVLGVNELTARLAPALIGILTIPVFYVLVSAAFGRSVGLISSGLLAVSTWHLYWSQNARYFVLMLLFYTISLMLFYLGIEKNQTRLLLVSLIFLGLAAVERLQALILLPILAVYAAGLALFPIPRPAGFNLKNLAFFFGPCIVIGAALAWPFLGNLSGWMEGFGRVNNTPYWIITGFVYYVGLPTISLGACTALYLLGQKNHAGLLFGLAAAVPPLVIAAISPFHYTASRYFFVSLTSWIVLAGIGTAALFQRRPAASTLLPAAVALILIGTPLTENYLYYRYHNGNRENWREAFEYIRAHQREGDRVILADIDIGRYYLNQRVYPLNREVMDLVQVRDTRVWFVVDDPTEELYPEYAAWIFNHARLMENFDVYVHARIYKIRVYLYDPKIAPYLKPE